MVAQFLFQCVGSSAGCFAGDQCLTRRRAGAAVRSHHGIRRLHAGRDGYPVDENEKFYIDGETNASVEFQGLEDSFGFSWGFSETENSFPMTGYLDSKSRAHGK